MSEDVANERLKELLLAEHAHLGESLLQNEEDGERRVSFFLSLAGAVGGVLIFLFGGENSYKPAERDIRIVLTLLLLLFLGYITLARVVTRNAATDRYKRGLARVRRYFLEGEDSGQKRFLPFDPYRPEFRKSWTCSVGKGGWLETITIVEALILGALAGVLAATGNIGWNVLVLLIAFLIAWRGLVYRANLLYRTQMWTKGNGLVQERETLKKNPGTDTARKWIRRRGFKVSGQQYDPCQPIEAKALDDRLVCVIQGKLIVKDLEMDETVEVRPCDALYVPGRRSFHFDVPKEVTYVVGWRKD